MTEEVKDKRTQLEKRNEEMIAKSVTYAKNINDMYRPGIEYEYYPDIPNEKRKSLASPTKDDE